MRSSAMPLDAACNGADSREAIGAATAFDITGSSRSSFATAQAPDQVLPVTLTQVGHAAFDTAE